MQEFYLPKTFKIHISILIPVVVAVYLLGLLVKLFSAEVDVIEHSKQLVPIHPFRVCAGEYFYSPYIRDGEHLLFWNSPLPVVI